MVLCPKLNAAFGPSATASLLSAGFPKVKLGWADSWGGSAALKEKPPIDGAGELSASFPLKPNPDDSFSSGFPNVKEGAGRSFSADVGAPKAAPPSGVEVRLGSAAARLPNSGAAPVDVPSVDVPSVDGDPFSFLSWEAAGKPNEKPPTKALLLWPELQLPSADPPLTPNVNPPVLGGSAFVSSLAAAAEEPPPNLNPPLLVDMSDKVPPNLNPPEEEDSEGGAPNLNPPAEALVDEESVRLPPNWKPAPEVDSDEVPNLNPPVPESDDAPKEEEPKAESQERRERGERRARTRKKPI